MKKRGLPFAKNEKNCRSGIAPEWQGQNNAYLNDDRDAARRIAKGDGSPVASLPKAEVESGATMTAKPFARLRRGEILLPYKSIKFWKQICM